MILTAIVAMTPEHIIGKGGDLPWNLPDDLKFFKEYTSGHPIVMGRKTFEMSDDTCANTTQIPKKM